MPKSGTLLSTFEQGRILSLLDEGKTILYIAMKVNLKIERLGQAQT